MSTRILRSHVNSQPAPGATREWHVTFWPEDTQLFPSAYVVAICKSKNEALSVQGDFKEGKTLHYINSRHGIPSNVQTLPGEYTVEQTMSSFNK